MKKICILGGGASALICACFAPSDVLVTLIEQNDKVGKKILATGNGRCNLTNSNMNKYSYSANIESFIKRFSSHDVINFFSSIGLETYADEQGRVYPLSNSAVSVLEVLKNFILQKNNVNIITGKKFLNLTKEDKGFKVFYEDSFEVFDSVVVALGNNASLSIFDKLGVKIKPFVPSLCALKTKRNKTLAGVRISNVKVTCKDVGFEEVGEVQFREDGVSGIVVFNLSAFFARQNKLFDFYLDFLPNLSSDELIEKLKNRRIKLNNYLIDDFLTGFFIKAINFDLLSKLKLDLNKKVCSLTDKNLLELASLIKNYKIEPLDFLNNNQVCSGGVCLDQLDQNLQALFCKGLYFIGEVVDVDGVCGGYNLQWAWTSGKIVGESLWN